MTNANLLWLGPSPPPSLQPRPLYALPTHIKLYNPSPPCALLQEEKLDYEMQNYTGILAKHLTRSLIPPPLKY